MNIKKCPFLLIFILLLGVYSCTNNDIDEPQNLEKATLSFHMTTPNTLNDVSQNTPNIKVLLFNVQNGKPQSLEFISSNDNLLIDSQDTKNNILVKLKVPMSVKGDFHGVVLMNQPDELMDNIKVSDKYVDVANHIVNVLQKPFDKTQVIPLSGFVNFNLEGSSVSLKVSLIHTLAKVNVTINENQTDKPVKFKRVDRVLLYHTRDRYKTIFDPANIDPNNLITSPTEVKDAKYLLNSNSPISNTTSIDTADEYPLLYTKVEGDTSKDFINEIYIPETFQKDNIIRAEAISAIVGIDIIGLDGKEKLRYYRVDFSDYNKDGKPINFKSILRNKVYVFNLNGAINEGAETPEEALTEESILYVSLQEWDAKDVVGNNMNGTYTFMMDAKNVSLSYMENSTVTIPYETNVSIGQMKENLNIKWVQDEFGTPYADGEVPFRSEIDHSNKKISIKTNKINLTGREIESYMEISLYQQTFTIKVTQITETPTFKFKAKSQIINGTYVVDVNLDQLEENYVQVMLTAKSKADMENLKYHIYTDIVDGIYIDESGYFSGVKENSDGTAYLEMKLKVRGTPTAPRDKTLIIYSNSKEETFLGVEIPFSLLPKKIFGFFNEGYNFETEQKEGFMKLFSGANNPNFGPNEKATVKTQEIVFRSVNANDLTLDNLEKERPDVILFGRTNASIESIKAVTTYAKTQTTRAEGQPAVIFVSNGNTILQVAKTLNLFKAGTTAANQKALSLLPSSNFSNGGKTSGEFYKINGVANALQNDKNYEYRYFLPKYDWDYVANGILDLGTFYPQLSATASAIPFLDYSKTVKYTGNFAFAEKRQTNANLNYTNTTFYSKDTKDWAYSIFRCVNEPVLCIAYEDFMSTKEQWDIFDSNGKVQLPARTMIPGMNELYEKLNIMPNGLLMTNALYWALKTSEYGLK